MARVIALPRRLAVEPLRFAAGAAALALVSMLVVAFLAASPVGAQENDPGTTTEVVTDGPSSVGNILPRPNSGQAPESANDPGGWQQDMVFALIGLGQLVIVVLATRDSRRFRRAQGRYP